MIPILSISDPSKDLPVVQGTPAMRLSIELVPGNRWGNNLREILPAKSWDLLRRRCYAAAGNRCEICGGVGNRHPVEAHEVWDWNDGPPAVQRLVRLIALCPSCHECKHLGRAMAIGNGPKALRHLGKVNGISARDAHQMYISAMAEWKVRSTIPWQIELSWLDSQGVPVPGVASR